MFFDFVYSNICLCFFWMPLIMILIHMIRVLLNDCIALMFIDVISRAIYMIASGLLAILSLNSESLDTAKILICVAGFTFAIAIRDSICDTIDELSNYKESIIKNLKKF